MNKAGSIRLGGGFLIAAVTVGGALTGQARTAPPVPAVSHATPAQATATRQAAPKAAPAASTALAPNTVVTRYCATCHDEEQPAGGLALSSFDVAKAAQNVEVAEKMIRKLQAGMMPPASAKDRPDAAATASLIKALENTVDLAAGTHPNPGRRTFQRLNRPEYARSVKNLLALDVDPGNWLPLDTKSANFDNIADAQALSPTLLEGYLNAASAISRLAIGDRKAGVVESTYTNSSYVSQHPWDRVEGAPYGTRGGLVVNHVFPVDGDYVFEVTLLSGDNSRLEDIDVSVDGERMALIPYEVLFNGGADGRGGAPMLTEPLHIRAGQHKIAAAFVRRTEGPYEDLIRPHEWSYAGGGSGGPGITTIAHMRDLIIKGPYRNTGISDTPSRQRVFACRPTSAAEERPCAFQIATRLGTEAYRRPISEKEVDRLMPFYDKGATKGGFEEGVRQMLEAMLSSPSFIFRLEREPEVVKPGSTYRVADLDLASRLSYFLWGTPPDQELLTLASRGLLAAPGALEKQARRMLADPRADALGERFAGQWLRLQDIDKNHPDPNFYPNFDENLAQAMRRETQMFFNHLMREDRPALELYSADYTFVNERLAKHYGIPGVAGSAFRKVPYPDTNRRGLLGQGSVLVQTSLANRTSPVLRGKWVMEVLLGTPPPPPPPNVPTLDETGEAKDGKMLTTRERMEIHRKNPTCNACHRMMDPIGLALDNFDVTARWRVRENGASLDTRGEFYDGTAITSPGALTDVLLKRPQPLLRTFTENLFAYALGRRAESFDQPAIRAIVRAAEADHLKMSSFVLGVIKSDAFRMKRAEAVTTTEAGASR